MKTPPEDGSVCLAPSHSDANGRAAEAMRIHLTAVALASALASRSSAQAPSQSPAVNTAVGVWRGTSVCLVRPSACNEEIVVYRIAAMKVADSLSIDALKIVRGEEQDMGVLGCHFAATRGQITCAIPQGVWLFTVRNDSLTGELRLADKTRFRDVRAIRSR